MSADRDNRVPRPRTGHDRRHLFPGRPRAIHARFTDDEYAELATAAALANLTPTGFCAQAALDTARTLHTITEQVEYQALCNLQTELFRARVTLNQFGAELARTRNDNHASTNDLDLTITRAADALTDLDGAISRVHRRLAQRFHVLAEPPNDQ